MKTTDLETIGQHVSYRDPASGTRSGVIVKVGVNGLGTAYYVVRNDASGYERIVLAQSIIR